MLLALHNILQAQAVFSDKLVAFGTIGDLPLTVSLTNIPSWEKCRVNQKVWTFPLITNYRPGSEVWSFPGGAESLGPQISPEKEKKREKPMPLPGLINLSQRRRWAEPAPSDQTAISLKSFSFRLDTNPHFFLPSPSPQLLKLWWSLPGPQYTPFSSLNSQCNFTPSYPAPPPPLPLGDQQQIEFVAGGVFQKH